MANASNRSAKKTGGASVNTNTSEGSLDKTMRRIENLFLFGNDDIICHVLKLFAVTEGHKPSIYSATTFLTTHREHAKEIGCDVHERFGFEGMLFVHGAIRSKLGLAAARELEFAWSGVGTWLP
jgi:hypothetical protein